MATVLLSISTNTFYGVLCVRTRRGCPILYVLAPCAPAKMEALFPSRVGTRWGKGRLGRGRTHARGGGTNGPAPQPVQERGTPWRGGRSGGVRMPRGGRRRPRASARAIEGHRGAGAGRAASAHQRGHARPRASARAGERGTVNRGPVGQRRRARGGRRRPRASALIYYAVLQR